MGKPQSKPAAAAEMVTINENVINSSSTTLKESTVWYIIIFLALIIIVGYKLQKICHQKNYQFNIKYLKIQK